MDPKTNFKETRSKLVLKEYEILNVSYISCRSYFIVRMSGLLEGLLLSLPRPLLEPLHLIMHDLSFKFAG